MSTPTQCCDIGSDGYAYLVVFSIGTPCGCDDSILVDRLVLSALAGCGCNRLSSLIPLSRGSFDVIVGMDWLSKRKFVIVCHEKVVRIPLEGDEILRVHGERTQGVVKTLLNTKVDEPKVSDTSVVRVPEATSVAKSQYRLAPLEMQELSEQLRELQEKGFIRPSHFPWGAPVSFVKKRSMEFI
ncbi:hypothetical protein Tco_0047585 [Tanacetum coccineum]